MNIKNKKHTVIIASVTAVLVFGGIGAAVATQAFERETSITGTIEVPQGARTTADLARLATITERQAIRAASQALNTTATPTEVELEEEDGFLVWEVDFADQEVTVDAGSGEVLLIETDDDDDNDRDDD